MRFGGELIGALRKGLASRPSLEAGMRVVRPEGLMGWVGEVAPDAFGTAALVASMQGANPAEQGGAAAVDLATGLGLSFGSRALFGALGHKFGRWRGITDAEELMGAAHQAAGIGGFAVPMTAYMAMNPTQINPFYGGYAARMQKEGEAAQREREQGLVADALANAGSSPRISGLDYLMSGDYGT